MRISDWSSDVCSSDLIPGGVGNTGQQVRAIADLRPVGYAGTPDFLKILLDKAAETGCDVSSLAKALVSGAALPGALGAGFAAQGSAVRQLYAPPEPWPMPNQHTPHAAPPPGAGG